MMQSFRSFAAGLALVAAPAVAQTAPPPKLVVVISVDQFSADLFEAYRDQFTGGFARLLSGVVFPSGYQSHAATETCPGHSTILTGVRPARTGIVGNDWIDFNAPRDDKTVNCAEDESIAGSTSTNYTVADTHLKVSTVGEWMKLANPATRVVAVAGKDRSAVMMAGHRPDDIWWFKDNLFVSYAGRTVPRMVARMNAGIAARIAEAQEPMDLPQQCTGRSKPIPLGPNKIVGDGRFARAAGDARQFRASAEFDESILALAAGVAIEMKLGQGQASDLLIVGASGTDYVGHAYGDGGSEMCLQLLALDAYLGKLFAVLDSTGVDYAVALTADHGGQDLPERTGKGARVDTALAARMIGKAVAAQLGLGDDVLRGGSFGDIYIDTRLTPAQRAAVQEEAIRRYRAHPQVEAVFTAAEIAATPAPQGPPEKWSLLERIHESFVPGRSGDLFVVLKPGINPLADPTRGSVATHGSPWDYDRRVPILFWRKGIKPFEQAASIETVDIAPTLAKMLDVRVPAEIDGKCRDLDSGPADSCM